MMRYQAGDLCIDVDRGTVCRDGVEIPLSQLSYTLLLRLVQADGGIVSVETLMSDVWPGVVVSPETVSQRIKIARAALDDDSKKPRYIAAVRGRGYRIVAPVSTDASPTRVPGRRVVLTTIAAVVVAVALLAAGALKLLQFQIDSRIEKEVVAVLDQARGPGRLPLSQADVSEARRAGSPDAWELFRRAIVGGGGTMDDVLKLDPDFGPAHAVKAFMLSQRLTATVFSPGARPEERLRIEEEARYHANRALERYPQSGIAHTALGNLDFYRWRWSAAEAEFAEGLPGAAWESLAPYAQLMSFQGKHPEAIALAERILELNTGNGGAYGHLGLAEAYAGDYEAAAKDLELALRTSSSPAFRSALIATEIARGNIERARQLHLDYYPDHSDARAAYLWSLIDGRPSKSALESLRARAVRGEGFGAGTWALAYLAAGDNEAALDQLTIAASIAANHEIDRDFYAVLGLKMNVSRNPVLDEPRFATVLRQIGGD